ncbi:TPA: glycosyltransferase [Photobacterium damselae]
MKVAYVYKQKKSDSAWSSAIKELGEELEKNDSRFKSFAIDNSNFSSLNKSKIDIKNYSLGSGDILIFNHAISFWLLFPLILKLKKQGVILIFLFHEHEHILGLSYCFNNFYKLHVKEWLRHVKMWYKVPFKLSTNVVCLTSYQGVVLNQSSFERLSYLGIDLNRFPQKPREKNNNEILSVMFAHDPTRFDKGDRFYKELQDSDNFKWVYGRDIILPYNDVYKKYHDNDIVFLPSDSESYSLVLAEAMATNCCVITNANVGIVQLLLSSYTIDELEEYGLFVCSHDSFSYKVGLNKAKKFLDNKEVKTFTLFNHLKLDVNSTVMRFKSYIYRIGGISC